MTSVWESSYKNAVRLFENAKGYYNLNSKSRTLKQAWNAAFGLPTYFEGRDKLLAEIDRYAMQCGINLDEVTGY